MSAPPTVPASIDEAIRHAGARRALRAARAVTFGLAVLAATGCASQVEPNVTEPEIVADAATADAVVRDAAVFETAVADAYDAPPVQNAAEAGHACTTDAGWEEYSRRCDENGWNWDLGCAAWGPFVPPEMPEAEV